MKKINKSYIVVSVHKKTLSTKVISNPMASFVMAKMEAKKRKNDAENYGKVLQCRSIEGYKNVKVRFNKNTKELINDAK